MNELFTSGQTIKLAVGNDYTVKDNEVFINNHLYRKIDLELIINENNDTADQDDVRVGIVLRGGVLTLPATLEYYNKWKIDNVLQTSLSTLVENINTAIQ